MNRLRKTTLLALLTLSSTLPSYAQSKWSAGYQAGFGTVNSKFKNPTLTNQLFVNRKISNKFELEIAIGLTKGKGETISENIPTTGFYSYTTYHTTYSFTLTAKYNCIQQNKWSMFIPLSISNGYTKFNTKFAGNYNDFTWLNDNHGETNLAYCLTTGLGVNLNLIRHLYLNAQFNFGIQTQKTLGSFDKRNEFQGNAIVYSPQIGIGYRF